MTRAGFLRLVAGGVALAFGAPRSRALGPESRLVLAALDVEGLASGRRPRALERLVWELTLRTSVQASYDVARVSPGDPRLFDTPFLYLWGDGPFPPLPDAALGRLRQHLELGGTLLADDGSATAASPFAEAVRREASRMFPRARLERLPEEHSVFRSYYLLRRIGGRVMQSPFLEGVTVGDRTPLLLCRNDLAGAWAQDETGNWLHECHPGGAEQRANALRTGVNVVLYALTVNYKQDQIHLPFILDRMRRSR